MARPDISALTQPGAATALAGGVWIPDQGVAPYRGRG